MWFFRPVHTTLQEFEIGGFSPETQTMFSVHTTSEKFQNATYNRWSLGFVKVKSDCDDHSFIYNRGSNMNYFIYTLHHFTPHGRYELSKLTSLPMCGFIAQLVEHRTGQYRGGHGFESRWSPRPHFFIYNRSSNMNYFIYTLHHLDLCLRKPWSWKSNALSWLQRFRKASVSKWFPSTRHGGVFKFFP